MSEPYPLTIWPKSLPDPEGGMSYPIAATRQADLWAGRKHFSDAELLCEYWRYDRDVWRHLANMPKPPRIEDVIPAEEADRRAEITLRFATHTHALEEN